MERELKWEDQAILKTQMSHNVGLDQGDSSRGAEKQSDSGQTVKETCQYLPAD